MLPIHCVRCLFYLLTFSTAIGFAAADQWPEIPVVSDHVLAQHGLRGEQAFRLRAGELAGEFGCQIHYEHYEPLQSEYNIRIILAHGFMRKLKHMRGWAEHWSSWGLPTTLITLCNSTLLNGHHQRNADDLKHLAGQLYAQQPIIFAGFSAGGLAAWLAAVSYPASAGYLGLDPVDSGKLAQRVTDPRAIPGMVLFARASVCNARNNFLSVARGQVGYKVANIWGASHCHFENPYDRRCAWVCGGPSEQQSNASIQRQLLTQSTLWLLQLVATTTRAGTNP